MDNKVLWLVLAAVVVAVGIVLALVYGGGDGGTPTSPGGY